MIDQITKGLALAKDAIIVLVVAVVGWKYAPALLDPAFTSDYEIAEINLLVVKLRPQDSERAVSVSDREVPPTAAGDDGAAGSSGSPSAPPDLAQYSFVGEDQRPGLPSAPLRITKERIVTKADTGEAQAVVVPGWSYVGTWRERWDDLIFDLPESMQPDDLKGKSIQANTDVFIRDAKPTFWVGWTRGERLGVLKAGASIQVVEVAKIPAKGGGYRIWVRS